MKNIFIYWTGEKPSLIEILHELMALHYRNGSNYRLISITKESFCSDYSNIPECFGLLCPAHQADVARVWAVCEHGGIWLDSDTIVMGSLSSLFQTCESKKGFFMTQNNECICNGIFGSQKNTLLLRAWRQHIIKYLKKNGPNIGWESIGNKFLTETYANHPELFDEYEIFNGLETMYPVNWDQCATKFLEGQYFTHKHLIREYQPVVALVNSVYKALCGLSKEQILESEYPLNYFINKSLRQLCL